MSDRDQFLRSLLSDSIGEARAADADGDSPRDIARTLNSEGVPPAPRTRWSASAITGNAARQEGILLNDVYRGVLVWNQVAKSRDPNTGRRRMTLRPETEWHRAEAPHLRIVSEPLWEAAQARRARRACKGGPGGWGRAFARPRRRFSGLLRCG